METAPDPVDGLRGQSPDCRRGAASQSDYRTASPAWPCQIAIMTVPSRSAVIVSSGLIGRTDSALIGTSGRRRCDRECSLDH
jgi:hypothetical protein